jgi:hypothetical protein
LLVPNNASVSCGISTSPSVTGIATATDNCGTPVVSYSDVTVGSIITRTWKATDAAGNVTTATQKISGVDNTKPLISTLSNVTVVCGSSTAPSVTGTPKVSDNCRTPVLTYTDVVTPSNITRTWTATDAAGNKSTSVQLISFSAAFSATVISVPTSSTYTGGVSTNLYIGYGAQSTALTVGSLPSSGAPYTYSWSGSAISRLSSTTSSAPVYTPNSSSLGTQIFTVTITNKNGCSNTASISICTTDITVAGSGGTKVWVCHTTKGKNAFSSSLQVLISQVPTHLNGNCGSDGNDRLGSCVQTPCAGAIKTAIVAVSSGMAKEVTTVATTTEEELKVTVMPNPTTNYFTLKLESKYQTPVELRVMDANGRVVDSRSKLGSNRSVQIGQEYSSGTYFAEITQGTNRKVVQLMKIK